MDAASLVSHLAACLDFVCCWELGATLDRCQFSGYVTLMVCCTFLICTHYLQPVLLGNQKPEHAEADQSRRSQDALATAAAAAGAASVTSSDPRVRQLDVQAPCLVEATEEASSMVALSAQNILAWSGDVSNVSTSQDEVKGSSTQAGAISENE